MVKRVSLLTLSLLLCVSLATGQGNGQGKGHGKGNPHNVSDSSAINISFGTHDREIIRDYYRDQYSNLPPGLAKRGGNLPPGLQKHLERDGALPPGLQKRITPFPVELERRLPPLPSGCGCGRVLIGQIAIILDRRSQRIIDIIHDVLNP